MTPGGRRSIAMVTAAFAIAAVATAAPRQPSVTTRAGESPAAPSESAAAKTAIESGPAKGWIFPVFSDKEGYRLYTLRGSEIRYVNANEIDVAGFSAVVFSGDASERVDTVLLSPQATFYPRENRASGNDAVRLILSGRPDTPSDDVEVTGRGWTYNHGSKKVSIAHEVRVTFHAQLNDILK
jgi:hypothetical protein